MGQIKRNKTETGSRSRVLSSWAKSQTGEMSFKVSYESWCRGRRQCGGGWVQGLGATAPTAGGGLANREGL